MLFEVPFNTHRVLDMLDIPNIKFKPTQIDYPMVKSSNLIITMATSHKKNIITKFKNIQENKIYNLTELSNIILYLQTEKIFSRETIKRSEAAVSSTGFIKSTFIKQAISEKLKEQKNSKRPKQGDIVKSIQEKILAIKNANKESLLSTGELDIEDPFSNPLEVYLEVANLIKENIIIVFNYLFG